VNLYSFIVYSQSDEIESVSFKTTRGSVLEGDLDYCKGQYSIIIVLLYYTSMYFSSSSRSAGATRVPISSVALMSFA
jgi:hypothetical protein